MKSFSPNETEAMALMNCAGHYGKRLRNALLATLSLTLLLLLLVNLTMKRKKIDEGGKDPTVPRVDTMIIVDNFEKDHRQVVKKTADEFPRQIVKDSAFVEKILRDSSAISALGDSSGSATDSSFSGTTSGGDSSGHDSSTTSIVRADTFVFDPGIYPTFPGGQKALGKYLQKNLHWESLNGNAKGKIIIQFAVMKNGAVDHVKILRDNVGSDCAEEALRAIAKSKWNPGLQNGKAVNVMMVLPISVQ